MPKITMAGSYFNAQSAKDAGEQVLTIKQCVEENVAPEDKPEEIKWVLKFEEVPTGVVLNAARLDQLKDLFDSDVSEDWHGKKVTVYCDPKVSFAGKKTGGVAFKEAPGLFTKPIKEL